MMSAAESQPGPDEARITAAVYAALGARVTTFSAPDPCVCDRALFEKYNAMPGGITGTNYLDVRAMREIIVPALAAADKVRSRASEPVEQAELAQEEAALLAAARQIEEADGDDRAARIAACNAPHGGRMYRDAKGRKYCDECGWVERATA